MLSTSTPSFSFGANKTATPPKGLSFGTPVATSAPNFNFGAPGLTTQSFGTPGSAPAFGTAAKTATTGFNFGGAATSAAPAPGLNFGAPAVTAAGGLNFGAQPTSSAPSLGGFNFGSLATTTTTASGGLNFSFGNTQPAGGLGGTTTGLFGAPATTQPLDPSKPAIASVGLGGVDSSTANITGVPGTQTVGSSGNAQSGQTPKLNNLPQELLSTVEHFKTCVRQRKQLSSDIARSSIRPLHKVQNEAESLLREGSELAVCLANSKRTANGLRGRTAAALPTAERAHRVLEVPHGIEYDSGEALMWIASVVSEGEERLRLFKRQLEAAQRQLNASPRLVTDQELVLGMRRIHESFVAVAGRLQTVHQQVEGQKAQYSALRKNILRDPTNVFASKSSGKSAGNLSSDWLTKSPTGYSNMISSDSLLTSGLTQSSRNISSSGPNPFTYLGPPGFSGLPFGFSSKSQTSQNAAYGSSTSQMGLGNSAQSPLGGGSPFSSFTTGDQSSFNLQKPPIGNKRGKH